MTSLISSINNGIQKQQQQKINNRIVKIHTKELFSYLITVQIFSLQYGHRICTGFLDTTDGIIIVVLFIYLMIYKFKKIYIYIHIKKNKKKKL